MSDVVAVCKHCRQPIQRIGEAPWTHLDLTVTCSDMRARGNEATPKVSR